jgi:hypothetical protein
VQSQHGLFPFILSDSMCHCHSSFAMLFLWWLTTEMDLQISSQHFLLHLPSSCLEIASSLPLPETKFSIVASMALSTNRIYSLSQPHIRKYDIAHIQGKRNAFGLISTDCQSVCLSCFTLFCLRHNCMTDSPWIGLVIWPAYDVVKLCTWSGKIANTNGESKY